MNLEFIEKFSHDNFRLLIKFSDWDRKSINGNSLGLFFFIYSKYNKPIIKEILIRNNGVNVGRTTRFSDNYDTLSVMLPEYTKTAIFSDLCINRMVLEKEGELNVYVADPSGLRHLLGVVKYSNNLTDSLIASTNLALRPILISSLGRSGSTVLANCLGQHPEITNIGSYPYEYRFFSYCLQAIYILSSPANHNFSMGGDSFEIRTPFSIGFNPFNHREYDGIIQDDQVREFYENDFTTNIAKFFTDQIDIFLEKFKKSKISSLFFVEKMASFSLSNLSKNLFNKTSEIVITRNFWDLVSSMIAFDKKRGTKSFFRGGNADFWLISMAYNHMCLEKRSKLLENIHIEYENLIKNSIDTIDLLIGKLQIDNDKKSLNLMIDPLFNNKYKFSHSTSMLLGDNVKNIFSKNSVCIVENILNDKSENNNNWDFSDLKH